MVSDHMIFESISASTYKQAMQYITYRRAHSELDIIQPSV